MQPLQHPFGIPTRQPNIKQVSQEGPKPVVALFVAMLEQGRSATEPLALQQPFFVQVRDELLDVVQRDNQRGKRADQLTADFVQVPRTVKQAQHTELLLVQAMVFEPDGILDDIGSDPLVLDASDDQIWAGAQGDRSPRRGQHRRREADAHGVRTSRRPASFVVCGVWWPRLAPGLRESGAAGRTFMVARKPGRSTLRGL